MHGKRYITFLSDEDNPTDNELLLELVLGLGTSLKDPTEENSTHITAYGMGKHLIRRAMKLLIERCNLPIPTSRADEFIHFHQTGESLSTITKLIEDEKCSKS